MPTRDLDIHESETLTLRSVFAGEDAPVTTRVIIEDQLDVAPLHPLDPLRDASARLENLGYEPGSLAPESDHALLVDGVVGTNTLAGVHGA